MFRVLRHLLWKIKGEIFLLFVASSVMVSLSLLFIYVMPQAVELIFSYYYSFIPEYIMKDAPSGNVRVLKDTFNVYDADNKLVSKREIYILSVETSFPRVELINRMCTIESVDMYGEVLYVSFSNCKIEEEKINFLGAICERDLNSSFYCDLCSLDQESIKKFLKRLERTVYSSFEIGRHIQFPMEVSASYEFYCEHMNDPLIRRIYMRLKYLVDFLFKRDHGFASKGIFIETAESNISGYRIKLASDKLTMSLYIISYIDLSLNNLSPKSEIFENFILVKNMDFKDIWSFIYDKKNIHKDRVWASKEEIAGSVYTVVNISKRIFILIGSLFIFSVIVVYRYVFGFIDKKLSHEMELLSFYGKKIRIKLYVSTFTLLIGSIVGSLATSTLINYVNFILESYLMPPLTVELLALPN